MLEYKSCEKIYQEYMSALTRTNEVCVTDQQADKKCLENTMLKHEKLLYQYKQCLSHTQHFVMLHSLRII